MCVCHGTWQNVLCAVSSSALNPPAQLSLWDVMGTQRQLRDKQECSQEEMCTLEAGLPLVRLEDYKAEIGRKCGV